MQDINTMKKIILIIFCLTALGASCNMQKKSIPSPYDRTMSVGKENISVQVASTMEQKVLGLSSRNSMPENSGMLFDFTNEQNKKPGFWMKDTLIPLDFVWIKDNKVLEITPKVPIVPSGTPDSALKVYYPPGDVDYVLEMNAGWSERHSIISGEQIKLP